MNILSIKCLAFAALFALTFGSGCSRSSQPPTPLPVQEIPAALEKAFSQAKPELKDLASQATTSLQAKDYSKAFLALQDLASRPGLTKVQVNVTSRATLTVNGLLQAAETKGDEKAAQTLKNYRADK